MIEAGQFQSGTQPIDDIERFNEKVCESCSPMACQPPRNFSGRFQGGLTSRRFGALACSLVNGTPMDIERSRRHIARSSREWYLIKTQIEGEGVMRFRDREILLRPGDFTLCTSTEPYQMRFDSSFTQIVLAVSPEKMEGVVRRPRELLGLRMDSRVGANGIFSDFLVSVASRIDGLGESLALRMEATLLELLATTLDSARDVHCRQGTGSAFDMRQEYIHRIKRHIRKNLCRETLTLDSIADAHGISTRYLHMLFKGEELSISKYIQQLRLESCRDALVDPGFPRRGVSEVAYGFGFRDASHFGRLFKEAFGDTPSSYRKRHVDYPHVQSSAH